MADNVTPLTEAPLAPPSKALLALEARTVLEFGSAVLSSPLLRLAPTGDGGPVLVLPGFVADDASTAPLRLTLKTRGYNAHGWSLGRNLGPTPKVIAGLNNLIEELHDKYGRRVRLVGWSLGGIYARYLARMHPNSVRQVVTLGSPFRMRAHDDSNASKLLESMAANFSHEYREHLAVGEYDRTPMPVPSTAIYSKTDGIVRWEACLEQRTKLTESIEVRGSHCGLGHNPSAVYAVLDRLAQPGHSWKPFHSPLALRRMYPHAHHAPSPTTV